MTVIDGGYLPIGGVYRLFLFVAICYYVLFSVNLPRQHYLIT